MSQFLIALHRPYGHAPIADDVEMHREIDELNAEMVAAGVRVFVGGLRPTGEAASLSLTSQGSVDEREGPYLQSAEFVDGFWVLEVASRDEALKWGRMAARACRANVEVRPFY